MDSAEYRRMQIQRCLQYADWVTTEQQKEFWRKCARLDWPKGSLIVPPVGFSGRPINTAHSLTDHGI